MDDYNIVDWSQPLEKSLPPEDEAINLPLVNPRCPRGVLGRCVRGEWVQHGWAPVF